jgi:hypothetical protein
MADFPIEQYLQAFRQRDANELQAKPDVGQILSGSLQQGASLAMNQFTKDKELQKQRAWEGYQSYTKDRKLVDAKGEEAPMDVVLSVNEMVSKNQLKFKGDRDGSVVLANTKGVPMGYKWVAKDDTLKFVDVTPTAEDVQFWQKSLPGYNFQAGQTIRVPKSTYEVVAKGVNKPDKGEKQLINIDADGKLYDANMQPITDTSNIDWSKVVKNSLPKPADASSDAMNKGKLAQGGIDSVNDIKTNITPDVFADIKIAMKDPTGLYKESLSDQSKKAYAGLRNAVGNILYIKTGAAATPKEIDEQLAKYSPSVAQSMDDWQKNTLGLLERDLNYYINNKGKPVPAPAPGSGKAPPAVATNLYDKYGLER